MPSWCAISTSRAAQTADISIHQTWAIGTPLATSPRYQAGRVFPKRKGVPLALPADPCIPEVQHGDINILESLRQGDQIKATGRVVQVKDKQVMMADEITSHNQTQKIKRQKPKSKSENKKNRSE